MLQPPRLFGAIIRTVSWIYKPQSGMESMPLHQAPAERVLSVTLNWTSCSSWGSQRPAEHAAGTQGWQQFHFPEVQEKLPVKSRRPKPQQIPDQGKISARKASLSSSLDLEFETTECFQCSVLARASPLTVPLHDSGRGKNI